MTKGELLYCLKNKYQNSEIYKKLRNYFLHDTKKGFFYRKYSKKIHKPFGTEFRAAIQENIFNKLKDCSNNAIFDIVLTSDQFRAFNDEVFWNIMDQFKATLTNDEKRDNK